jgi:hypothetical protein
MIYSTDLCKVMDEKEPTTPELYLDFDIEQLATDLKGDMRKNKVALPPLFNPTHPKFTGLSHLYSIYYDSYMCVLCGLYHPGIMLMGQLIESTLKEIILVHDGINHERTFGTLIRYSENANGKLRKESTESLLPHPINVTLNRVNGTLRNPYMHLNYSNIFQGETIRGIRFPVTDTIEGIMKNTERVLAKIRNGEIELVEIDPVIDKVIADVTKRQNDPKWAITWAWEIYPFFELLVDEYLTFDDYGRHREKFAGKYETIPLLEE